MIKFLEWAGVITAILYSLFVALNIGLEFLGFSLLFISALLIGLWAYKLGYNLFRYIDETIYGFEDQKMFNHSLTLNLRFREKWGSIYSYVVGSQFLDLPEQNRLTINNNLNIRIIRGLSVRISAYFRFIRDQINLPKGEASVEDLLLRQRQISTNFQNRISMGLSYTFGSIFNNIVNQRL